VLKLNLIVLALLVFWAGAMWVAPYTLDHGTVHLSDTGVVGLIDNQNVTDSMPPFARWIYHAGDSQCHQLPQRSLVINGNQMPFCARCVAIYTFMAIGLAITAFPFLPRYDDITQIRWWVIVGALVPIGIDGVGQLLGLWESTNAMRFLTGGLIGAVTGLALGYMLRELGPALSGVGTDLREWNAERRAMKGATVPAAPPPVPSPATVPSPAPSQPPSPQQAPPPPQPGRPDARRPPGAG
jgi:uncharacterized membrane protein